MLATRTDDRVAQRLRALGIELPVMPTPRANYVPVTRSGRLVFVSGQVPRVNGTDMYVGKVGDTVTSEDAYQAARICAINIVAQLSAALDGDLSRVTACLRVRGFVNAVPDFSDHPTVINGAFDLIVDVFGDLGRHSRTAIGAGSLPRGYSVEVDADFEVDG